MLCTVHTCFTALYVVIDRFIDSLMLLLFVMTWQEQEGNVTTRMNDPPTFSG